MLFPSPAQASAAPAALFRDDAVTTVSLRASEPDRRRAHRRRPGARRAPGAYGHALPAELTKLVGDYIEAQRHRGTRRAQPRGADHLEMAAVDPAGLLERWRRLDLTGRDALILSACVQMPSLAAIILSSVRAGCRCCRRRRPRRPRC